MCFIPYPIILAISFLCRMKLLLCINRFRDFKTLFEGIAAHGGQLHSPMPDPASSHFIFSLNYLQHEIDICETGFGLFQTAFKVTKAISQKKYHLALKASFCNAYKAELNIGDIVNVIKDKPGDIGIPDLTLNLTPSERDLNSQYNLTPTLSKGEGGTAFADLYDLGLLNSEDFPHFKGAFINMNNSYMNVLMPFRKVVSVTVNQYANVNTYEAKREKYKADIETGDGLGFVYPCMYDRQPFYQLNAVERNLATGESDFDKAREKLNETLLDILQKL